MISYSIRGDLDKYEKRLRKIGQQGLAKKAANFATNRAIARVKTTAAREISRETGLAQKKFRKRLTIKKSTWRTLYAEVKALRYAPNLIEFVTTSKQKPGAFRKREGVVARAWKTRKVYRGTFIVYGANSGKPIVVKQSRKATRGPGGRWSKGWSDTVYGPSVRRTFIQDQIQKALHEVARPTWIKNFHHDLRRRLERLKPGGRGRG